jgi:hypothetical protein
VENFVITIPGTCQAQATIAELPIENCRIEFSVREGDVVLSGEGTFISATEMKGEAGLLTSRCAASSTWFAFAETSSGETGSPVMGENLQEVARILDVTRAVVVQDRYAYVGSGGSVLAILDVSDPANPSIVGTSTTLREGAPPWVAPSDVMVVGKHAFVTDGDLYVLDISNPVAPVQVSLYTTPASAEGVCIVGHYAYVADSYSLQVVDISNPAHPIGVGALELSGGYAHSIFVAGNYAYIAYQADLRVIDISDPAAPVEVGSYRTEAGSIHNVFITDRYALIAADSGLEVLDVADPTNAKKIGEYSTSGPARGLFVTKNLAYVTVLDVGLRVVDISKPAEPVEVGAFDGLVRNWRVYARDEYAYVTSELNGLHILQFTSK